jgi:hypothetical protein
MPSRTVFLQPAKAANNDEVTALRKARGCTVEADLTGTPLGGEDVGFEALAIVYVPNLDGLVWKEIGLFHPGLIDTDTALVIKIAASHRSAMDLGFEQFKCHKFGCLAITAEMLPSFSTKLPRCLSQDVRGL